MGVQIFLGQPPSNIKKWIKDHAETKITFFDGSSETYKWSGEISQQTMIDAGLYDSNGGWIKHPETVDIGNIVTSIGDDAFLVCTSLTSVTIPDSVMSIGRQTFGGCTNLESVTISGGVTSIDARAFFGCSSLTNVMIPDSVTSIGVAAFTDCTGLESVTIVANGGDAEAVKSMMIHAGAHGNINWIMPNT